MWKRQHTDWSQLPRILMHFGGSDFRSVDDETHEREKSLNVRHPHAKEWEEDPGK